MRVQDRRSPIAIVGIGAMFPGRGSTAGYWKDIVEGADTTGEIPATHWLIEDFFDPDPTRPDKTYSRRGAFIPSFPFDPIAFGLPPRVIETTDTVQLIALYVAKQVLEEAQRAQFQQIDRERTSVVLGVAAGTELIGDMASRLNRPIWIRAMRAHGMTPAQAEDVADRISSHYTEWRESTFPGLLGNVVAGRIANRLDLGGTNFTADAACASSLAAVRYAAQELWLGDSDMVLAGGSDALNNIFMYMCFSKTPAMSATGRCRPFSDDADGTLMGEGCGIFALRRLEDAERDGNKIYGIIRGIGAASDGHGTSVYAPRAGGQARALARAYAAAGYSPRTVELMEAHGTGTRAGDAAEFAALNQVFAADSQGAHAWCALGSVKSQIGHTKSAAGAASLIKATAALHHKVLPPSINVRAPNPKLGIAGSPFYLNTTARPWIRDRSHPRRASVSSFGFGGSNFHVALEEYTGPAARPARYRTVAAELFVISAENATALAGKLDGLILRCRHDDDLPYHAHASQQAFSAVELVRFACVASTCGELRETVDKAKPQIAKGRSFAAANMAFATGASAFAKGKIGFLFAGQGSQYVGMGASLAINFDQARAAWDSAADDASLGEPKLHEIVFPPPAFDEAGRVSQSARLTQTENAQPAIGLVVLSQLAVIQALGIRADCVAGHSFGEIMALHAAGALAADAAIRLARTRGLAMARAAQDTPGAMLAVFSEREAVQDYVARKDSNVVLANDNAPDQVIVSGSVTAIDAAELEFKARGCRVRRLDVATAFHSPLVAGAADDLQKAIEGAGLRAPQLPVYANSTAEPYPAEDEAARALLARQLASPVRFRETIEAMYRDGVRIFIEIGPSDVLRNLVDSTLRERSHLAVSLDDRRRDGVKSLQLALAQLAVTGLRVDFGALWTDAPAPPLRPVAKKHDVLLNGTNYGKPYPPRDRSPETPQLLPSACAGKVDTGFPTRACTDAKEAARLPIHSIARRSGDEEDKERASTSTALVQASATSLEQTEQPADDVTIGPALLASLLAPTQQVELAGEAATVLPPSKSLEDEADMNADALREIRKLHDVLAAEHRHFIDAISQSHLAFIRASQSLLESAVNQTPVEPRADIAPLRQPLAILSTPAADTRQAASPAEYQVASGSTREATYPAPVKELSSASIKGDLLSVPATAREEPLLVDPPPSADRSAVAETVRSVVADKTGYPSDMLDMDMDLEAELGIDSIKQVEILSALRERLPQMPRIEPAELATLRTLAQIAGAIAQGTAVTPAAAPAAAAAPEGAPALGTAMSGNGADRAVSQSAVAETVRSVVADKTGYPSDMLDMDMDLEAELGIDSIKQVEILSALRERLPQMPRIEPTELATLRTLAQIASAIAQDVVVEPVLDVAVPAQRIGSGAAFAESAAASDLYRQAVELAATPSVKPTIRISNQDRIEITTDAWDMAESLAEAFARYGLAARLVETPSGTAQAVIATCGLAASLDPIEMHRRALAAARIAAPAMAAGGGWFIVLQDAGGDFGRSLGSVEAALRGGLTGLAKTAAQEWPRATVRAIDIATRGAAAPAVAQRLAQEILFGGADVEVGLAKDGSRLVPMTRSIAYEGTGHRLIGGERIVVSGGARGITAAIVRRLAGVAKLKFLLLGRSGRLAWPADIAPDADGRTLRKLLAGRMRAAAGDVSLAEIAAHADALDAARHIDQTLAAIRAAGSEAVYEAVDITDASAVGAVIDAFRQTHGSISGLIHGAGVIADKLIADKTDAQFERVFRTKVDGFRALWSAIAPDEVAFVALFASVAARFGNPGQADYAMANEVLNRVAWAVAGSRPKTRVMSFNWGPWFGGMVNDGVRAQFEARGIPLIPPELGIEAFLQELVHQGPAEIVFAGRADMAQSGPSAFARAVALVSTETAPSRALAHQA